MRNLIFSLFLFAFMSLFSCLSDSSSMGGFELYDYTDPYANNTTGYISFGAYGNWTMTQTQGESFCTMDLMKGVGNSIYSIPFKLKQNTTGEERFACFKLEDDANPSAAYLTFVITQHATRGDGSLGNAPLITKIEGSDNSEITVSYDKYYRPESLYMQKDNKLLRNLKIQYQDSLMTVIDNGNELFAEMDGMSFQPDNLVGAYDSVGYYDYFGYGNTLQFSVEERKTSGELTSQALLLVEQNLTADGLHTTDTLKFKHRYANGDLIERNFHIDYSQNSNRTQSLDVNQLLLGVEECNPYALLSMYKYARNSYIIERAYDANGDSIKISSVLNSDKSVNTLTITDIQNSTITYTFTYDPISED